MTGLLLINLGTPDSTEPREVGKYLREFLMDPLVIDIPWLMRWLLVNVAIVPRRSHASSELYKKVWMKEGSPLLVHTENLAQNVQKSLGPKFAVRAAMRYGNPSIASALESMREAGVDKVIAFPLYPQYSIAATESSILEFEDQMRKILPEVSRFVVPPFYSDARYLDAVAEVSRPHLTPGEYVVFSYHGLPEHQVKRSDLSGRHCLSHADCCDTISVTNSLCYRAHCFHTTRELVRRLDLQAGQWEVGFQSRLGRRPWIQPFSDVVYEKLAKRGVRRVTVLVPSFTADCLETLEEVAIRGNEAFRAAGGEKLTLVPSLNSHPVWVDAVVRLANVEETKELISPARTRKSEAPQSSHLIQ